MFFFNLFFFKINKSICLEQVVATLLVIEFFGFVLMLRSKFTCILGSNYVFFFNLFFFKINKSIF